MKKTKYFILVNGKGKREARPVNGYFEYVGGLPLGLHKTGAVWTVSELSTGCKITDGRTRAEAMENARPHLDRVRKLITEKYMQTARDTISAAYAG